VKKKATKKATKRPAGAWAQREQALSSGEAVREAQARARRELLSLRRHTNMLESMVEDRAETHTTALALRAQFSEMAAALESVTDRLKTLAVDNHVIRQAAYRHAAAIAQRHGQEQRSAIGHAIASKIMAAMDSKTAHEADDRAAVRTEHRVAEAQARADACMYEDDEDDTE
jgi:hypothetical protein